MKLQKLMRVFCQRQDVAMESVRFLFDGNRIRENQTPNELEMEDGDSIRLVDRLLEKTRRHVPSRYWSKSAPLSGVAGVMVSKSVMAFSKCATSCEVEKSV